MMVKKRIRDLDLVYGTIVEKGKVYPVAVRCDFECPTCDRTFPVLQLNDRLTKPKRCGCGRQGNFRLFKTSYADYFMVALEDVSLETKESIAQEVVQANIPARWYRRVKKGDKVAVQGFLMVDHVKNRWGGLTKYGKFKVDLPPKHGTIEKLKKS